MFTTRGQHVEVPPLGLVADVQEAVVGRPPRHQHTDPNTTCNLGKETHFSLIKIFFLQNGNEINCSRSTFTLVRFATSDR